jgi:N-acetylmuramoyl-L-alanine amidase
MFWTQTRRALLFLLPLVLTQGLAGCAAWAPGLDVDTRYRSVSQDSRAQFLVIHYTQANLELSLKILARGDLSVHYLLSDESPPRVYRLVDETQRAYHAGFSRWQNQGPLNAMSIGIEIVHPGVLPGAQGEAGERFVPYREDQIAALIPLVRDIVRRHGIRPDRVVGHSDIAPGRKVDPGPLFPWKRLADQGLAAWPDAQKVATHLPAFQQQLPDAAWFQQALSRVGYEVPRHGQWDEPTRRVMAAFQMRFRPSMYDGQADAETAALLQALTAPAAP